MGQDQSNSLSITKTLWATKSWGKMALHGILLIKKQNDDTEYNIYFECARCGL